MKKFTPYSDNELIDLLKHNGNDGAFTELYNRYWKKLLAVAKFKLESETEAEEVIQEVFLQIWNRRKTITIRNSFNTYITSCVKYEIFAIYAQRQKETQQLTKMEEENFVGDHNTADNWIDYEIIRARIEQTVQNLPEKCQLVFRLSRNEGLSYKDIADELNITTKGVEAHITKALKIIRVSVGSFVLYFIISQLF